MPLKNDRYLRALKGEPMERPPVWMMRQAGRYLPEFRELKEKYDFFTRVQTPELATEITLQPIRRFPLDAAILFSDILVIPQAMGMEVQMVPGKGPYLPNAISDAKEVDNLNTKEVADRLSYVFEAIDLTKKELDNKVPLIGFAGSPWTILCYMVEGQGSKTFDKAKGFCFSQPELAHKLLEKITDITISYLKLKVEHGCNAIQIFDSWGGLLSPLDYQEFSWKYANRIIDALAPLAPTVMFAKGCWYALKEMSQSKASALGIDWTLTAENARYLTQNKVTLQGNFDPARLLSTPKEIEKLATKMVDDFGTHKYIANLGHGILPNIPVENAQTFIETIVNYSK